MKQFPTIQKLDLGILYALELTSSISVLLLAFGLIASMANVLTKGSVLSDSSFMQGVYAWSQCIGIDASIPGAIMRTLYYYRQREWGNAGAYTLLSMLLLFTAMIVSSIESIQQTLNITLSSAYAHVFIPIEGLIWIRSYYRCLTGSGSRSKTCAERTSKGSTHYPSSARRDNGCRRTTQTNPSPKRQKIRWIRTSKSVSGRSPRSKK